MNVTIRVVKKNLYSEILIDTGKTITIGLDTRLQQYQLEECRFRLLQLRHNFTASLTSG